jgi:hypothetical protein
MGDTRMECMLTAMSRRMLWNTGEVLLIDLRSMNIVFMHGMMRGMSCCTCQASLCPVQLAAFVLCLSLTMNPYSTKMTSSKFIGVVQARTLFQDQREMASPSWSQTFSLWTGALCMTRAGASLLYFPSQNVHHFPAKPG